MADTEGMSPELSSIIQKIIAESGGKVSISSGYRTRAQQEILYNKYKSGQGNLAAKPGSSMHEHGMAVDFGGDLQLAGQLARKYGLVNSVPGEPWHYTLGGESGAHTERYNEYDLGSDTSSNPQDVLANRMQSVLSMIGQPATAQGLGYENPNMNMMPAPQATLEEGMVEAGAMSGGQHSATPKGVLQNYAYKRLQEDYGMSQDEMGALITLWNKESGWDPTAQNPTSTAYGIAQFLNGTWSGTGQSKTSDPYRQIDAGLRYITQRYGSPSKALNFHLQNGYY